MRLPSVATRRELRELGAFVRFCIGGSSASCGTFDRWIVSIGPSPTGGYTSTVTTIHDGVTTKSEGTGQDGTLAAWNALGNISRASASSPSAVAWPLHFDALTPAFVAPARTVRGCHARSLRGPSVGRFWVLISPACTAHGHGYAPCCAWADLLSVEGTGAHVVLV